MVTHSLWEESLLATTKYSLAFVFDNKLGPCNHGSLVSCNIVGVAMTDYTMLWVCMPLAALWKERQPGYEASEG